MIATLRHCTILAVAMTAAGPIAARGEPPRERPKDADFIQEGFESERTSWQQEYTDTTVRVETHDRSDRAAHGGRKSERFLFEAGQGNRFFVSEALPKIPVTEDLAASVYIRSDRAGPQIFGWVVLPGDIDPETRAPSYVLVPGTVFSRPDRWEKLELSDLLPAIEEQARVLRARTRRPVPIQGAYLERVVVNLMGGAGVTEVFLDDLKVGPVPHVLAAAWADGRAAAPPEPAQENPKPAAEARGETGLPPFQLSRGVLEKLVGGERYVPWFPTAIEAPGADPVALRQKGFDVLVTGPDPETKRILPLLQARNPMYLLPRLSGAAEDGGPQRVLKEISEYPLPRSVLLWSIGDRLGRQRRESTRVEEVKKVREVLAALDETEDVPHLATATIDGEWKLYSRPPSNLDVIGIDMPIWGTCESFMEGLFYLKQRRDIVAKTNLETLFWAWLPATTPREVVRNIWGTDEIPPWGIPSVQPEQLRLMTYLALAAGCRGISFVGDADLTRPAGEPLLIEMGFLNAEIDLFEAILAGNINRINDYPVNDPDPADRPSIPNVNQKRMPLIKEFTGKPGLLASAIPLNGSRGSLLLVGDYAGESQWQTPQMAYHDLVIRARLPESVQFLEVSPGGARFLEHQVDDRAAGGTRLTIPDFGVTTMILCTTDLALCERIQRNVNGIRPLAVQWAIRQAELQLAMVREGHERLKADGHRLNNDDELKLRKERGIESRPTDADDLLEMAGQFLKSARVAQEAQDYSSAWDEARRATRPLRSVMYGYWHQGILELQKAVRESFHGKDPEYKIGEIRPFPHPPILVNAASCPPAISFSTLPQMHIWKDWVKGLPGYQFGPNRVPSGSFDSGRAIEKAGWTDVSQQVEGVIKKTEIRKRERTPLARRKEPGKGGPRAQKNDIRFAPEVLDPNDHVLMMSVKADPKKINEVDPYIDVPAAAVLSPPVRVAANNLIRISVQVRQPYPTQAGKGGVIVRDSIGGEFFQFRTPGPIAAYSRVVLYRKAPADGELRVMLGYAGYGEIYFDDFRIQVIEQDFQEVPGGPVDPGLVRNTGPGESSPRPPDPRTPAAALASPTRRDR